LKFLFEVCANHFGQPAIIIFINNFKDPIKYVLNVRDALKSTEQLFVALLRDRISFNKFDVLKKNKEELQRQLLV